MKGKLWWCTLLIVFPLSIYGQASQQVNWMTFEEMEAAFSKHPKMVFIDFWAEWCVPCKRMDLYVFTRPEIINRLNRDFYPVKMNAEAKDTIYFGGREFMNPVSSTGKTNFHQLAILLGKNAQGQFSLPTIAIYDEQFKVIKKYHRYLHGKDMLKALSLANQGAANE